MNHTKYALNIDNHPLSSKEITLSTITFSELSKLIAAKQEYLTPHEVYTATKLIVETITESLANGEKTEIRGFGTFSLHKLPPRMGRNPKTGESIALPLRYKPHFKPGKILKERVKVEK